MELLEWIFDGIGTEIVSIVISLIIGAIGGGTVGYKVAIKKTLSQKQSAGDGSEQRQELQIGKNDGGINSSKSKINHKQSQKAGNGSIQTQIGGINDDRR